MSREVSDTSKEPAELFFSIEDAKARQQSIELLRAALQKLKEYDPTAHLLVLALFDFTADLEEEVASLKLTEEEQSAIIAESLIFLKSELPPDITLA